MDQEKIDYFHSQLLQQKQHVLGEMADHNPVGGPVGDMEEKADQAAANLVDAQIAGSDGQLLKKIEYALERIAAGTYSRCDECGDEIPIARLEAKPSVSLCVDCQEKKDKGLLP